MVYYVCGSSMCLNDFAPLYMGGCLYKRMVMGRGLFDGVLALMWLLMVVGNAMVSPRADGGGGGGLTSLAMGGSK